MTLDFRVPDPKTASKAPKAAKYIGRLGATNRKKIYICLSAFCLGTNLLITGCGTFRKEAADAQPQGRQGPTAVDVAIAKTGKVQAEIEYPGTTFPVQEVLLRSQVEGRLLQLKVDVGDVVKQGQVVAQLDETLLLTTLKQEQAELAALKSEVARAQNQVSNARAEVEQARLEQQQAQADSARQQKLVREGAISAQLAEQARTTARTSAQARRAAQEQVRTEQQAVAAAQGRVAAQQAVVAQTQEQLSYAKLVSPIDGIVLEKVTDQGNLIQPGNEVMTLGDFSRVKVQVEVSDKELSKIRIKQAVRVRLDAFPNQIFTGEVSRITPAADQVARLVPVEVIIPNSNGRIGRGLLARVSFENEATAKVVVPQTAISQAGDQGTDGGQAGNPIQGGQQRQGTVFVVTEGGEARAIARPVTLGARGDSKVEILSGLKPGERFVVRSGKPLKDREPVALSIISETPQRGSQQ